MHSDSSWIIFGLTTNLLCIFDICWVPTAVVLAKNDVLLLVPTGEVLELGFPKCFFNKSLIKWGKIVSCLMQYSKKCGNDQKLRCSSSIATEHLNFKILSFLLYGYHTPQLKNKAIFATVFSPHNFKLFTKPLIKIFLG